MFWNATSLISDLLQFWRNVNTNAIIQIKERTADTAQRLRMRKWHRLHLAQRRRSISRSSWCMSRNRVMFSSGLEESLSRILKSSSFWHHIMRDSIKKGEIENVRVKCLISLLSASFHWSNHRTQTHEIWGNLAPASKNIWELNGN